MRCQAVLWAVLLLIPPAFSQHLDSSSAVYGYPAAVNANRVYSPGQNVKVDEPHGVYTGVILMDDYYFLRPLAVTETERKTDATMGSLSASVRRATSPTWQTATLAFVCENRDFKVGRAELARIPDGKQLIVGSRDSVCTLKTTNVPTAPPTSHVFVEPWQTLVRDTINVNAGRPVQYNFPFVSGTALSAQFQVQGGLNDKIQVLLLDVDNYQLYSAHRPYKRYPGTSGVVKGIGKYDFKIPQDGVYYIVVDNGQAWLMPRNVTLHLDAILPQSTSGQCAPEFLEEVGFPNRYEAEITSVLYNAESEVSERSYSSDPDELRARAGRKDSIAASLERLDEVAVGYSVKADALAGRLRERSSELEQEAVENEPPEPDYDDEAGARSRDEVVIFDIGKLFSEL